MESFLLIGAEFTLTKKMDFISLTHTLENVTLLTLLALGKLLMNGNVKRTSHVTPCQSLWCFLA